jgi:hypothetical protein
MAKKSERDDGKVFVVAGARFMHDGNPVFANDVVRMTPRDAADMKALRFVRDPKPEDADKLAAYNRRDMRTRP